jgi:hypothetical protein
MKKRYWLIALAMFLALGATACKKKAAQAKVETISGVTYIHNPPTPLHPNKSVTFDEELTLKDTDETGQVRLFKPGRFTVDPQDNVYIGDDSDMAIKIFDAQGNYLHSIGRQGSGPGEFTSIGDIIPFPDGKLLVTDYQARRTSFFSPQGQFVSSFTWKKYFGRVYLVADETFTLDESVFAESGNERWIKTVDFNGEEKLNFGKFTYPIFKSLRVGSGMIGMSVPWSPASVFAGDQARKWLYHCPGDRYLIEVYDQQAKLFRKIDRPYDPVAVTGEDIDKLKSRFANNPDSPAAKIYQQMELPKVKPVTDRLIVDSAGKLWLQTNEVKKEGEKELTAYDIFNADGFYDARVWLDARPDLFVNGKMYRMVEDETTGMRRLKRYLIVWREG